MNKVLQVVFAVGIYATYIAVSRYLGFANGILDWLFIIACSLVPAAFHKRSGHSVLRTASEVTMLAVVLFFGTFWLIMILFNEGP
jgi:hypothetical protein